MSIVVYGADPDAAYTLERRLELTGAEIWPARSVRHALELARAGPDVVALAWTGDRRDHLKLVRRLQQESSPVPVLVALTDPTTDAWVASLDAGADACVGIYQNEAELWAQCTALARRGAQRQSLTIKRTGADGERRGAETPLSEIELGLMKKLTRHPGRVVPTSSLVSLAPSKGALAVAICRLRPKVTPHRIRSVRNRGYVLQMAAAATARRA